MNLPNPFPHPKPEVTAAGRNGVHIVFVLDKSGSMAGVTNDTLSGYNAFLKEQKSDDATISLMLFDYGARYVFQNRPSKVVYDLTTQEYQAGGGTALLDAFGQAMEDADRHLATFEADKRPACIFVVITDGEENSSNTKFRDKNLIKAMVSARQENGWVFTFLGANIDAFAAANSYGININSTATFNQAASTADAFTSTSQLVGRYRKAFVAGASAESIRGMSYTSDERTKMNGGK